MCGLASLFKASTTSLPIQLLLGFWIYLVYVPLLKFKSINRCYAVVLLLFFITNAIVRKGRIQTGTLLK